MTIKASELQMLLDPAEKGFDFPPIAIQITEFFGGQIKPIRQDTGVFTASIRRFEESEQHLRLLVALTELDYASPL
ncbi:hypothetical protein P5G60_07065 [Paenibacillus jamilae]|nr:hypothetical protein [Paenibacillus jamilae]